MVRYDTDINNRSHMKSMLHAICPATHHLPHRKRPSSHQPQSHKCRNATFVTNIVNHTIHNHAIPLNEQLLHHRLLMTTQTEANVPDHLVQSSGEN
mmetsp:Transcript_59614/g.98887  ORF Transcript_59614/g.98887 Transcript_59614/m.98887 type:complete len:96 (+) Transcript_59614:134-421(+)